MSSLPFWDPAAGNLAGLLTTANAPLVAATGVGVVSGPISLIPGEGVLGASLPWPNEISPWETIKLAGVRAPGLCRVEGGKRKRYDHRIGGGASGETASSMGYDPGEFTITLTLWTQAQWTALQNLFPLIQPKPGAQVKPRAVKVEHPALALLGIYDIYVENIELPVHIGKQMFEFRIDCWEYLLPQNEGNQQVDRSVDVIQTPGGPFAAPASAARQLPADPSQTDTGANANH